MTRGTSSGAGRTALGGVMAAASLAFLWLASITPSGRMGVAAVAGLFPMAAVLVSGRSAGYLCWAASGILGLIILPDKGVSLIYLAFLGLYPVVKEKIEGLRKLPLEWVLKLAYFNIALTVFWTLFRSMFMPNPPAWLANNIVLLYLLGNAVFVCYDFGLSMLIGFLRARIRLR